MCLLFFITLLLIGPMELLLLLFPFKHVSKGLLHNYATTTPALFTNTCVCTHACMLDGTRERSITPSEFRRTKAIHYISKDPRHQQLYVQCYHLVQFGPECQNIFKMHYAYHVLPWTKKPGEILILHIWLLIAAWDFSLESPHSADSPRVL